MNKLFPIVFVLALPALAEPPAPLPAQFKTPLAAGEAAPASGLWWSAFHDPELSRLEEQALAANPDLVQAAARVEESRAALDGSRGDLLPHLSAPLQASRQRTTNTGAPVRSRIVGANFLPPGSPDSFTAQSLTSTFNDFRVPLAARYEIDVFGRLRHAYGESKARVQASEAERRAVELSLTAQVADQYFALRAIDSQIAVLDRALRLRSEAVGLQRQRSQAGSASDVDVLRAQVEEANTEADRADAVQARAEAENALAELCGRPASDFRLPPNPLEAAPPPAVPATVPTQPLTQRPDLIEAERRMAAAGEGIASARAEFFPKVGLSADYGYESAQSGQLLQQQSHVWSVTGGISIPIFDGGKNRSDLRAARARADEAAGAYRQAVVAAVAEVEDALSGLRQRALQADSRHHAAQDAARVATALQRSYREGAISYFEVIDAQRQELSAELLEVRTLGARYAATVGLIRAIGGQYPQAGAGN